MPYKDPEKQKEYQRNWVAEKREMVKEQSENNPRHRQYTDLTIEITWNS